MSSPLLKALKTLRQRRTALELTDPPQANNNDMWLDPANALTSQEIRQLADTVYELMRHELRIERERHRGY